MKKSVILLALYLLWITSSAIAAQNWQTWVAELKMEATEQGIDPDLFDNIFSTIPVPDHRIIHYDKSQPEHRLTFMEYRNSRVDKYKIFIGRKEFQKNKVLLEEIGNTYGVDPCIVASLWGVESSYGRYMGKF